MSQSRPRMSPAVALVGVCLSIAACGGGSALQAPQANFEHGVFAGPVVGNVQPTSAGLRWELELYQPSAIEFRPAGGSWETVQAGANHREHEVVLDGLSPSTTYEYRLVQDGTPGDRIYAFTTAPEDPSAPVRYAVIGDMGCGCPVQLALIALIEAADPDLVILTGDIAYEGGARLEVRDRFLIPFASLLARIPFYVALGNHDVLNGLGLPTLTALPLPMNDETGTEHYYAFDFGCTTFVCLNAEFGLESAAAPQVRWLERTLMGPRRSWTQVVTHRPAYSRSRHGDDPRVGQLVVPLLEAHGVDFLFSGHDHNYQRTHPMQGGQPIEMPGSPLIAPAGPIYITTGGGGRSLYNVYDQYRIAASAVAFHYTLVDATPDATRIRAIRVDGEVIDDVEIRRSP